MQAFGINYLGMCQHQNPPKIFGSGVLEFGHSFGFRNLGFILVLDLDFGQFWILIVLDFGFRIWVLGVSEPCDIVLS